MVAKSIKQDGHEDVCSPLTPHLLSVLRVVAALLFFVHGTQKLLGFRRCAAPAVGALADWRRRRDRAVGGALMLLGLFTRPVAFILSGQMAVAYFMRHAPGGMWPILNGGELAVLFCFLWLFFVAAGPGPWSIDRLRNRA